MTNNTDYIDFYEWFHSLENYSLKSERFYDDLASVMRRDSSPQLIVDWLKSAYMMGKENETI